MLLSMGITFVLKLLMSGKMIDRLGVFGVLISLPIALIILSVILLLPFEFSSNEKGMLWFFSLIYLVRDVLKYSLLDPLFLALFQPLSAHLRLKGHTIVKGLVDPLGLVLVGGMLFVGEHFYEESMYVLLAVGILAVSLIWLWSTGRVNKEGLEILRDSLKKRFLEGQSIPFVGKSIAELLETKLQNGSAAESIYALRMLEDNPHVNYPQLLLNAMDSVHGALQLFALRKLEDLEVEIPQDLLAKLSVHGRQAALRSLASKILLRTDPTNAAYAPMIQDTDEAVKKGAIAGLILCNIPAQVARGTALLTEMLGSPEPSAQRMGLWLIKETNAAAPSGLLMQLLHAENPSVVQDAIDVVGRLGMPEFLPQLIHLLRTPTFRTRALEALHGYDLEQVILMGASQADVLPYVCKVAGRHTSQTSTDFLIRQLRGESRLVHREALEGLAKNGFNGRDSHELSQFLDRMLQHLVEGMRQFQWFRTATDGQSIAAALEYELHGMVDQILIALSMQYNRALVMRARQGLRFHSQDHRAGALEILDQLLPRTQTAILMPMLEVLYLDRAKRLRSAAPNKTMLHSCIEILHQGSAVHDAWTITLPTDNYLAKEPKPEIGLLKQAMRVRTPFLNRYAHWLHLTRAITLDNLPMHSHSESQRSFSPIETVLMLKASTMFSGTPENTLAEVAAITHEERVSEGDILFRKGDPGDCMYIIAEGAISIADGNTVFATLGKNDFFGELALVETEPRSADAIAKSDCLLLRIDQDDFYELIEDRTEVARSILVILAQRLRRQNETIRMLREGKAR